LLARYLLGYFSMGDLQACSCSMAFANQLAGC
jgi:hypothetical protein